MSNVTNKSKSELSLFEQKVQKLEQSFLQQEQLECSVTHVFGPGVYIREVTMPTGAFVIGHKHLNDHLNTLLKGHLILINEDGTQTDLKAPYTYVAPAGRKIAYVYDTVLWHNIYATKETDVEKLETMFIEKSITWQEQTKLQTLQLGFTASENIIDYYKVLQEYGLTEEEVRKTSENTSDRVDMPNGVYKFSIATSSIEGKGIFASGSYDEHEIIGPARINNKRTVLGRYTNHSKTPNAMMVLRDNNDIDLVAIKPIAGCKGGLFGDEITIDYRQALNLSLRRH